jgi:hypothetical protein
MIKNLRRVRDLRHFPGSDLGLGGKVPDHPFAEREDKRSVTSDWEGNIVR